MKLGKKGEAKPKAGAGIARLPTLSGGFNNDPKIIMEMDELKEQNKSLQEKIKKLEEKMLEIAKSKGQIEFEKNEEEKKNKEGADTVSSLHEKLENKDKEIVKLKAEIEEKISQCSQVATMKKIIQQKNEQVNDLKGKLKKYEKVE